MKKIIVLALLLLVFSLQQVSSQECDFLGTYQQNKCLDIYARCDNCTYLNISTLNYPNSSSVLSNQIMTADDTLYNYTFCDTGVQGTYIGSIVGDDNGVLDTDCIYFLINYQGFEIKTPQSLVYIVLLLISVALFGLTLYGSLKIEWGNPTNFDGQIVNISYMKYLKVLMFVFSYLLLTWIAFLAQGLSRNFLIMDGLTNLFFVIYWFLISAMLPIFVVTLLTFLIRFIKDKKIQFALKRGIPLR